MPCRISVPWPGIEPMPPAVEPGSLNPWTTREVPVSTLDSTCKWYHLILIFLFLTYFTSYDNLWVHPQMAWFHSILGLEPLLNLHEWGIFWQLKAFIQGTATLLVGTTLFVRLAIPEASEWRLSEYPLWTALLSKCRKSVLHLPSKELTRAVMFLGIDHPFQMSTFHYDLQGMVFHKCI